MREVGDPRLVATALGVALVCVACPARRYFLRQHHEGNGRLRRRRRLFAIRQRWHVDSGGGGLYFWCPSCAGTG